MQSVHVPNHWTVNVG